MWNKLQTYKVCSAENMITILCGNLVLHFTA